MQLLLHHFLLLKDNLFMHNFVAMNVHRQLHDVGVVEERVSYQSNF